MRMRWVALAAAMVLAPSAGFANAPQVAATAPPRADAHRTYASPMDALIAADLDYLVTDARRAFDGGDRGAARGVLVFLDDMSAGRWRQARQTLNAMPGARVNANDDSDNSDDDADDDDGAGSGSADFLEPFLLSAEGRLPAALEAVDRDDGGLPPQMSGIMRGLLYESAGRLEDAARAYAQVEHELDVRAPPAGEPQSLAELQRALAVNRTANTLYRAALVNHRLRRADEARRLYQLVDTLAPNSADVDMNMARLARGQGPVEPALDARRALGRWLIFVADYMAQAEGLASMLQADGPQQGGLTSPSSAMFLQFALALDPSADDWRLYAANQLLSAGGYDGAARLLAPIRASSPYAPEAELVRASIALRQNDDVAAASAAGRAVRLGGERWAVLTSAGDVYRSAGLAADADATFARALTLAATDKDRADVLRARAYARRFAGDLPAAVADARAALALDQSDDTRMLAVSILMDDSDAWADGVRIARALFVENPQSVSRLNTLGYALIQKPEGLDEGYRLLWRGFALGERDYAVIDSLGWAYYLHGAFDQARALVERANDLTGDDKNPEILDHLGDVYWRLGRETDARAQWRAALAARPDALRRASLNLKVENGLSTPAPTRRTLPQVRLPVTERNET